MTLTQKDSEKPLNILVVDDDPIVRSAVKMLIKRDFPDSQTTFCGSVEDAITHVEVANWNVLLVDLNLGKSTGLVLVHRCKELNLNVPILIMSSKHDNEVAIPAFKFGAKGFISKDQILVDNNLSNALTCLIRGQTFISANLAERLVESLGNSDNQALSQQETAVLVHIGSGRSIKESAARMGISEKTVRTYRTRVLEKLSLKSDNEIVRYAIENCLIDS